MSEPGVAFEIVTKTLSEHVNKFFPEEDNSISRILRAVGQISIGMVAAGTICVVALAVREYLASNERELVKMKNCVKRQSKALNDLEDLRNDLADALNNRKRAQLPPPPNVNADEKFAKSSEKYGVLMDENLKDEESILEGYMQEKFRIQQRLESLEAKARIYNQGCQQLIELVTRRRVPLAVLNMYVADAKTTCKELDRTIDFAERHLLKLMKQIKSAKEALSKDELGKLTQRDLETFIAKYHQYLTDLEEQGAYAYLFAGEPAQHKAPNDALAFDQIVYLEDVSSMQSIL